MNRKIYKIFISLIMITMVGMAQDDNMGPMDPNRREQMESLRIWKMTEFLGLTAEQSEAFFPRLKEFEDKIHENQNQQRDIMKEIYKLTEGENKSVDEKVVKDYATQLADLEREISDRKQEFVIEIGEVLTADQQLKFIVFDSRFRNRLMRSLCKPNDPQEDHRPRERKEP